MKTTFALLAVPAAIATSLLSGCSSERITARTDPGAPSVVQVSQGYDTFGRRWGDTKPEMITRSGSVLRTYTGTIIDIDYAEADRELTLKDSQGGIETFVVGKTVQGLNEAKVGDKVSVDYYLGYNAEVRKPTAEEAQNPLVVVESVGRATGRAEPDADPASSVGRRIRAVVTIEGMDRAAQTVTVKGPRGKYYVARVADPSNFDKVHIGDTIVLTFTEATAISLRPA
jgi:hypothetical protein